MFFCIAKSTAAETIQLSLQSCGGLDSNTMSTDQCLSSGSYVRGATSVQAHTALRFNASSTIDIGGITSAWIVTQCSDQSVGHNDAKIYWGKRYISGDTTWNQYTAGQNWGFAGGTSSTDRTQTDISGDTEIDFSFPCSAGFATVPLDITDIQTNGSTTSVTIHLEPNDTDSYFALVPALTSLYLDYASGTVDEEETIVNAWTPYLPTMTWNYATGSGNGTATSTFGNRFAFGLGSATSTFPMCLAQSWFDFFGSIAGMGNGGTDGQAIKIQTHYGGVTSTHVISTTSTAFTTDLLGFTTMKNMFHSWFAILAWTMWGIFVIKDIMSRKGNQHAESD